MDDKALFRIAVIGVGKISIGSHIPAALGSGLTKLVALVDPDTARARKTAEEFGLNIEIKANISELTSEIDGVIIATPNHLHAPLAIKAMELGYHVLIEKPLASTLEDAQSILATQIETGKVVAIGYCTRFYQNYQLLRELLKDNFFGNVRQFAYQTGSAGGWSTYSNYILDRNNVGGGVLVVTGTHFIDRMLDLFGYPDDIQLQDDSKGGPEANARLYLQFQQEISPISGYVHFSKTTKLASGLVIHADKGTIVLSDNQTDLCYFSKEKPEIKISLSKDKPDNSSPFLLQLNDFIESCQQNRKPMVSAEEGLKSIQLLHQAYQQRTQLMDSWYSRQLESVE